MPMNRHLVQRLREGARDIRSLREQRASIEELRAGRDDARVQLLVAQSTAEPAPIGAGTGLDRFRNEAEARRRSV